MSGAVKRAYTNQGNSRVCRKGPLILELNARPGLNIQIANKAGLLPRLKLIEKHHKSLGSINERVSFARDHFAA